MTHLLIRYIKGMMRSDTPTHTVDRSKAGDDTSVHTRLIEYKWEWTHLLTPDS